MTALEDLSLFCCSNLRTLPASIMHLERLQKLWISESPLEDMPCIEALRASPSCRRVRAGQSRIHCAVVLAAVPAAAATASTPSFRRGRERKPVLRGCTGRDVLATGIALKAWPLPLVHGVEVDDDNAEEKFA